MRELKNILFKSTFRKTRSYGTSRKTFYHLHKIPRCALLGAVLRKLSFSNEGAYAHMVRKTHLLTVSALGALGGDVEIFKMKFIEGKLDEKID